MGAVVWGLLGPETLSSERRTRTLGLGATVRLFNDLAVPGLGGVWFAKQVFLASLGVAVAEALRAYGRRASNIEVTNAIEALSCWLALTSNGWKRDARLRGATKMRGKTDLSFANARRTSFYVTQPMRRATIQPLRALGLVESAGERFNAFGCTQAGLDFVKLASADFRPYNRAVLDHLIGWASGDHDNVTRSSELTRALSPLISISEAAREFLRERLVQGTDDNSARRRSALDWVDSLFKKPQQQINWNARPNSLSEDHWRDLRAGALFFTTRDSALALLDQVEVFVANQTTLRLDLGSRFAQPIVAKMKTLRGHAQAFLDNNYDPSPGFSASLFCRECIEPDNPRLLESLVRRDGRGLLLRGCAIVPGGAFRGAKADQSAAVSNPDDEGTEVEVTRSISLPDGISHRVSNLFLLNIDLQGQLEQWLNEPDNRNGATP